jgi:DNA-binding winged helix-turn-helix (wHTH) protein
METSSNRRRRQPAPERFRFDVASGTLWQGSGRVPIRARTAAVLRHLLERRGDVVSRDELRRVVWGKRHGSEHGPKQCVRELRSLFCDAPAAPRYIETVGQSGYRLIGDIELMAGAGHERDGGAPAPFAAGIALCVGREPELEVMDAGLAGARRGERQVLFIAGEPGIGKTTLIDAFAGRFDGRGDLWVVRGQCVPHDGPGEAYGPLLTAAEQLATGPVRTLFVDLVRRVAPRLLTQMPAVFDRREMLEKEVEAAGGGPEQALREFIHVFEQLSRHLPGILVIEDAHWADASTCNWISAWALRRAPANLLLVVSYRPGGTADRGHAARQMLAEVRRAPGFRTLELSGLTTDALARYLDIRFPENAFSADVASVLQERTEGHALFVAGMIEDWLARGILSRRAGGWGLTNLAAELAATLPTNLQELIDRQLSQIADDERRLLELASAAGLEFSAAALAESADRVDAVERQCEFLVERQLLLRRPEPMRWPDGTDATGYGFRHALYRHAIYETIPANLRRRLHLRIGLRLEQGHGKRANEIAAVLSNHFALGGDDRRAALYGRKAAETALLRGAAREAQAWLRRALSHIARWRPGRARDAEEIRAQTSLGAAHNLVDGFASPPAAAAFERAYVLSRRVADSETLIPILTGLFNYRTMTNDTKAAKRLAARILRLAQGKCASAYAMDGYNTVGYMNWKLGRYAAALPYVAKVSAAYRVRRHGSLSIVFGEDPGIACRYYAAVTCIMRADAAAAERHLAAGMAIARAIKQPFAVAEMLWSHCVVAHECGDAPLLERWALEILSTCEAGGIDYWRRPGRAFAGWAAAARGDAGGLERMGAVLQEWRDIAMFESMHYMLALYAEICMKHGRPAPAGEALAEALALVRKTGECWFEAELHRLRGELALRSDSSGRSVNPATSICFRQAARVARRQGARLLELRALVSLADERAARGEHAEAVRILAPLRPFFERGTGLPAATAAQTIFARSREVLASASRVGQ